MFDNVDDRPPSVESTQSAQSPYRRLKTGDRLGDRFVIVRFLAQGGMGEVYEATDLHLEGKHCALKTLRPEIAADSRFRLRFQREVLLAREVRHPNVCPTYDLFHVAGPDGPVTFLTMKLLRGESLLARLKRAGHFDSEPLADVAKQMAAALDAAHRAGVIHRDFKPGNVMLAESTDQKLEVSITDFGLSRAYESDATLSETGQILGTPGYIAPELIEGHTAEYTVDVYAFGVVLYEMATGEKPKREADKSSCVPPSSIVPGLSPVWDRIILGCLESDPEKRFPSAGEAMALLEMPKFSVDSGPSPRRVPPSRFRWIAGAMALLGLVAVWFALPNLDTYLHPLPQKRFVALMSWPADSNPEHRPLLKGVLETVGSRLARAEMSSKNLLVISPNDVTGSAITNPVDAVGALGANLVLAASIHDAPDGVAVVFELLDALTSRQLRRTELQVSNSDLSRLPDRAAVSVANLLDVRLTNAQWKDPDELVTVSPAAYQFFARAEDLISQSNDIDPAIEQYQKAVDVDPRFALAYAKLSVAYSRKYETTREKAYLSLAERNSGLALRYNPASAKAVLSRATVERLLGKVQEAMDDLQRAIQLDPGNPQILLDQAFALRALDRRAEEQAVYKEILKERPNFWPAYYELGFALSRDGNYQQAADAFAEASAVAPHVSRLLTNLGTMYMYLDRTKDAEATFRRSLEEAPNETAYMNLGTLAFGAGEYRKALGYYEKARDLRPKYDLAWRNIADIHAVLGDTVKMKEAYSKAAEIASDLLQTNPTRGTVWTNLAFYEAKLGHAEKAREALHNAEARGASDRQSQFKHAQTLFLLGQREEALQLVLECLKKGLSPKDVELALDLKELRSDARYQSAVAALKTH